MARNQVADTTTTTGSRKGSKTEGNSTKSKIKSKIKNTINGNANGNNKAKEIEHEHEAQKLVAKEEDEENDVEEEEADSKKIDVKKKKKQKNKNKKQNNNKKKKVDEEEEEDANNESALYNFPMHRINRIIKGESDVRITQEAVFLINKASEKFLQLFSTEAYACSFLDKKNHVGYQHLSSVVSKRRRFDFLSDFVPEKVKVEDALKETPSVET